VKPLPLTLTELTVTGAVPDEISVSGCVAVDPTTTFPKDSEVALNCSCAAVVVTVPVPLN
jgi:hypothetical protein